MAGKREFTDRFLKSVKPAAPGKRHIVFDAQVPNFGIRVTDRCSDECKGAFVLVTRFPGSSNPVPRRIGDYPATSLAKARQTAREWRDDIQAGIDPKEKEAERKRQEQRRHADTFQAVFDAFAEDHLSTLRTGSVVKKVVDKHVTWRWADRPVTSLKRADVNELVRSLKKEMPIGANRVLAYLKKFFGWAVDQELIEASPAASVRRPTKEAKRDRVLSDEEIRWIWQACGEGGPFGRAFKFMLATGQRRTEVGAAQWREIDKTKRTWTLSRDRTKADRAHEVPLSDLAMSIMDECPRIGDFVFSTGRGAPRRSESPTAPVAISGWSKSKTSLDAAALKVANAQVDDGRDATRNELPEWHLHDLRRTCATHMARLGIDRVVIAKILNHAENEVTAIYDRHRYDAEKRRALDLWGARLSAIVGAAGVDNVVHLSARG